MRAGVALVRARGERDRVILHLSEDAPWEDVLEGLRAFLAEGAGVLSGMPVLISVGRRDLGLDEVLGLLRVLSAFEGLSVEGLSCDGERTRSLLGCLGLLAASKVGSRPLEPTRHVASSSPQLGVLLVRRSVRSGQRVEGEGDVVVLGDVHRGGEVLAGRSVFVWGSLDGLVHAGLSGEGLVAALRVRGGQVRIGNLVAGVGEEFHLEGPFWLEISGSDLAFHPLGK